MSSQYELYLRKVIKKLEKQVNALSKRVAVLEAKEPKAKSSKSPGAQS